MRRLLSARCSGPARRRIAPTFALVAVCTALPAACTAVSIDPLPPPAPNRTEPSLEERGDIPSDDQRTDPSVQVVEDTARARPNDQVPDRGASEVRSGRDGIPSRGGGVGAPPPTADGASDALRRAPDGDVYVDLGPLRDYPGATSLALSSSTELTARIAEIVERPPFDQMRWGIVARDLHDGTLLFSLNAHQKFTPASNMKVLAGAAALSAFGPDFRFRTDVFAAGPLRRGTVAGDLVVVGSGDPTLSDRFHPSWRTPLEALADSLWAQGVRTVEGSLLIDVSAWDSTSVPGSRMIEDVAWNWGASGGAFAVQGGEVVVSVRASNRPGESSQVSTDPVLPAGRLRVDIRAASTDTAIVQARPAGERGAVEISGTVPPGWGRTLRVAQGDPVRVAGELLYEILTERGIRFDGGVSYAWDAGAALSGGCVAGRVSGCPAATRLATLTSPPLTRILDQILGPSDNWVTDQVVRALAQRLDGRGGWREGGEAVTAELARSYAVYSKDLDVVDASGLSAHNLATPRALVDVLTQLRIGPHGERFRLALAEPGEDGTTLEYRLRSLRGRVFAKTGSLRHVNSLSGYLVRDNGREMVFSILTNNSGLESREVRDAIDALVVELSHW